MILRTISASVGLGSPLWARFAASMTTPIVVRKFSASTSSCALRMRTDSVMAGKTWSASSAVDLPLSFAPLALATTWPTVPVVAARAREASVPILWTEPEMPAAERRETVPQAAVRMVISSWAVSVWFDISVCSFEADCLLGGSP